MGVVVVMMIDYDGSIGFSILSCHVLHSKRIGLLLLLMLMLSVFLESIANYGDMVR